MGSISIDFVLRDLPQDGWGLVLIEEGPWDLRDIESHLRRLQERVYGCIDAVLNGGFAAQYPESVGKPVLIQLDAYDVPEPELRSFFERFAGAVLQIPDYAALLTTSAFVSRIEFALNVDRTHD